MTKVHKPLVAIILSSYNGEKYIEEQLQSIKTQSYKNIKVYIHDDGSKDRTVEVIRKFTSEGCFCDDNAQGPKFILLQESSKLGYPQCFTKPLVECPKADYYAFCDQDDVWETDKIERAVKSLIDCKKNNKKEGFEVPLLYTSCVEYTDELLNHVRYSRFAANAGDTTKYGLHQYLFDGGFLGMTYVFNEPVRESLRLAFESGINGFKDMYISAYCSAVGTLIYDKQSGAKYRRHTEAVTNALNPSSIYQRYINKLRQLLGSNGDRYHEICTFIFDNYSRYMPDENRKMIGMFCNYGHRLQKAFYPHKYRVKGMEDIFYRLMFLIGKV